MKLKATAIAIAIVAALGSPSQAVAGGGGSGSGASGSGDTIISTILAGGNSGSGGGGTNSDSAPRCYWRTLKDLELIFILHVAASMPELAEAPLFGAIAPHIENGLAPGLDLQVRYCDGVPQTRPADVRVQVSLIDLTQVSQAVRSELVTKLTPPELSTSPPLDVPVLINEPVFNSVSASQWNSTVKTTLTRDGKLVHVEASPASLEVTSLEAGNDGKIIKCVGRGLAFDPNSPRSAGTQAVSPEACVLRYSQPTSTGGSRDKWWGYALMRWDGRYRLQDLGGTGPWIDIGDLYSFRIFQRSVEELPTIIQHP